MFSRYVVSQVKHNSYFLVGLGIGLWLALAAVPLDEELSACEATVTTEFSDEFEPQREKRPMGPAGQAGRSVQRPRYYSTELGMRGGLLAGVLSSEDVLATRAAALNQTAIRLQPALRFFITASKLKAAPGRANVVGFTDTREMLKPFHALKYLADNYLEEYDFFFLVSDTSFVNSRRLLKLVSKLSVSQDIYMGTVADDDTHYCTLEGGILLSNSVLRAIHGELDWCVRNSYSPHHHENLGRCVLHSAHVPCTTHAQGENYTSMHIEGLENGAGVQRALVEALADAVVARPALEPRHFYQLHAYVSRVLLQRAHAQAARLRAAALRSARRHPRGFRNATWPPALRLDAGLAPPAPPSRFDHLRWTRFNVTHAFMPDDHRVVAPLSDAYKKAIDLVVEEAAQWGARRWGARAELAEGAWCWEPPRALRYRLLLRVPADEATGGRAGLVQVEAARALGAARLAPARYVTESARVTLLLPLPTARAPALPAFLQRYEAVALQQDKNTALVVVVVQTTEDPTAEDESALAAAKEATSALVDKHHGAIIDVQQATAVVPDDSSETVVQRYAARGALAAALPHVSHDALLVVALPHMEFTEEFLNRVRMNTIMGEQWFLPLPFSRFAQYAHPAFVDASGARPAVDTGRFASRASPLVLATTRHDYETALQSWQSDGGSADADAAEVLAASRLRALVAPEPALLLEPRGPPCRTTECLKAERDRGFNDLQLGARHALAKLLLQTQAELA